jgi:C_GCAxxG_C_C family probable redox protein
MENTEKALEYFSKNHSCSQSILCAFAPQLGLDYDLAFKISSALGGGMARQGKTCGAVSGALMVIGLKFRNSSPIDEDNRNLTYEKAQQFLTKFIELNGSQMCKDLVGYDISTDEGIQEADEKGIFEQKCPNFVKTSAEILNSLL